MIHEAHPARPRCDCGEAWRIRAREVDLHIERPDTESEAWKHLLNLIEDAVEHRAVEFAPRQPLGEEHWHSLVTLPESMGELKSVRRLKLYGSSLVRIPPEIGEMVSLEGFDLYTSYRLHWFPYEITRCVNLIDSTVSTRALYGNYKYRSPFPDLRTETNRKVLEWMQPKTCSVCDRPFTEGTVYPRWISLWVATDVLPLLVYACSKDCIDSLPIAARGYLPLPHQGGRSLEQPPPK